MLGSFEIFGLWLVVFSFIKNNKNWKVNLLTTCLSSMMMMKFFQTIDNYQSLEEFIDGAPMCTKKILRDRNVCLYYDAVFTYFIGQILWVYHALPTVASLENVTDKSLFYYGFHSMPIVAMLVGCLDNWTFNIQIKIDLILIIAAILNGDFAVFVWFGFCKEREQFDRSNFSHVHRSVYQSHRFDESDDEYEPSETDELDELDELDDPDELDEPDEPGELIELDETDEFDEFDEFDKSKVDTVNDISGNSDKAFHRFW